MKSIFNASLTFLSDPKGNYQKIYPYLRSKYHQKRRKLYELFGNDKYSKPYPGHDKLLNIINKKAGYFVVCGGNDGLMVDPTYYYEKFLGWKGIIIEPLPLAAHFCRFNRSKSKIIQTALVSDKYDKETIKIIDCNAMSVTENTEVDKEKWIKKGEQAQHIKSKEIVVPAMTLDAILDKHLESKIDLIVIDVEGSEISVLDGFDIKKYKPEYILIEVQSNEIAEKIDQRIGSDYDYISNTGFADRLYKKN